MKQQQQQQQQQQQKKEMIHVIIQQQQKKKKKDKNNKINSISKLNVNDKQNQNKINGMLFMKFETKILVYNK